MRRCLGCMKEYKEEYQVCPFCGYEVGTPPKEAYHMVPGTLLAGRYIVGQVLGFGGFGVTYIGYDIVLARNVAIKEYLPSEFSTRVPGQTEVTTYAGERTEQFQSGLGKFLEEAAMLAKLQAANGVVQIFNSFKENATAYIVMEYLEGKTLKTYIEEKGKLSVEEAKEILHPIMTALKDVHELGILHRDIAPDNIFLTNDGRVKLLDFGASRFATTSHSKSLSVIIKQGYAPVEQYRSRGDQGTWTDVYSLAATFYKMVTGITPEDAMERVEKEELKKPSKLGIEIPKNTENAIMNALNIKIEDRTQNIEILEKELYQDEKVKLRFVHLKKADVGKWPVWAKVAVSTASLAVAVFAILLMTGVIKYYRLIPEGFALPEGKTRVPNLVNENVVDAEIMMSDAELYIQIVDKQYSEYIPKDMVLTQNVDRGKIVDNNQIVEVVVSGGLEIVYMRDVRGYYKETAIEILSLLGIVVEIEEEYGDFAPGAVIAQSIEPDAQTYRGAVVVLTVSKGYDTYIDTTQEVTIPDFAGMTMEEAKAEARKYGLYLVKTSEQSGKRAVGSILEQTPTAGETGHQGDVVEVVTVAKELVSYMPDVQYKGEVEAIAQLQNMGLVVNTTYEENASVAKGKVISQSIAPQTEVKTGDEVVLVISLGTEEINLVYAEWSEWVTELPEGVDKSNYEIETKTQYQFRDKSTMTSLEPSVAGWEQYDSVTTKGEFGPWSAWSTEVPAADENREISEKVQYSYSDYVTQISNQSSMSGYDLIDTRTYYLDDYNDWSEWSTSVATASDTRKVETKQQYRSRTREWTSSNSNSMSGYNYSHRTETAGIWSDATETYAEPVETVGYRIEVQTREMSRQVVVGQQYNYSHKKYWGGNYSDCEEAWYITYPSSTRGEIVYRGWGNKLLPYTVHDNHQAYSSTGTKESTWWYDEVARDVTETQYYTLYSTRTINYTYHFWRWLEWTGWNDAQIASNGDTEVESRTVYRYADKVPHYEYTFGRWNDYTAWSDTAVSESSTRKVRTQTIYQYRDKENVTTYYHYQWGSWSGWRDEKIERSDTREVQERTLYRYREK